MKKSFLPIIVVLLSAGPAYADSFGGLPPCQLTSLIDEAGAKKEAIYGDEGGDELPPYEGFTAEHRINSGIFGTTASGLTTNHGSTLPSAWGYSQFSSAGEEFANTAAGTAQNSTGTEMRKPVTAVDANADNQNGAYSASSIPAQSNPNSTPSNQ